MFFLLLLPLSLRSLIEPCESVCECDGEGILPRTAGIGGKIVVGLVIILGLGEVNLLSGLPTGVAWRAATVRVYQRCVRMTSGFASHSATPLALDAQEAAVMTNFSISTTSCGTSVRTVDDSEPLHHIELQVLVRENSSSAPFPRSRLMMHAAAITIQTWVRQRWRVRKAQRRENSDRCSDH